MSKTATPTVDVNAVIQGRKAVLQAAEELLRSEAQGAILGPDEMEVLVAAGITDNQEHESELNRVRSVLRFEETAGTKKERSDLAKQVKTAEKVRSEKLPKLRKELEETVARLEAEIAELNRQVDEPSKQLESMEVSCDHLRNDQLLPKHIVRDINFQKSRTKRSYHHVTQAKTLVETLPKVIATLEKADESDSDFTQLVFTNRLQTSSSEDPRLLVTNPSKVLEHTNKVKAELAEAQSVIDGESEGFADSLDDIEKLRDYYIK